ncbi:amino acid ABC transporter substrate-binding protein [Lacrimispora sp. NSJ-141]|uniref:Amino acid ABC transporter substrate-binding protein n=1 Tax=Lientehia hominis TaxID=2897778 RepID=A0AAP2W8P5_9FIRM|nr:amino acid ABC transporter substrate-binding protein [Lientehia hominis]MCD2492430.1 amino acid ABC transporter substrate-binding protein [Lientehia hominis]
MKKLMVLLMTTALIVASLAGCGGKDAKETTSAKKTTEAAKDETTKAADNGESKAEEKTTAAEEGSESGTFTVGFDQDFPPMGFVGDDGEFTGFDLELAAEVAKRLGLEIKYQPITWDFKDMELNSGTIDCIWNGFTMNGREDEYTWSEPYLDNKQVFVVNAEAGIVTWDDLKGKAVTVQVDSSAEAALKDDPDLTATFGSLDTCAEYNTAFMELESGAVDAIAMDVVVAGYQIESRGSNFVILEQEISTEEYGIGFKKGNEELRDKVQATLEEMAEDGTMSEISMKWFGSDITTIGK